jgi:hypothetical protein
MVVVTQKAASPPWVLRVIDLRDVECSGAPLGADWAASPEDTNELPNPTGRAEDQWVLASFGGDELFGLALDDAPEPDIYATPTISYRGDSNVASGRVWRVDGTTGAISVFAVLPNGGVGLGNIAFDGRNRQFFVSNLEDGKIYRLDLAGLILDTFDPFAPDSGAAGMPPLGDRVWAVDLHDNRLYFGTWTEDSGRRVGNPNRIYSVGLDDCGGFAGTEQLEITLPTGGRTYTSPATDLAFDQAGEMLVAERSIESDFGTDAHLAQVREYAWNGTAWTGSGDSFQVGSGVDAGGGVDYVECVPTGSCASAAPHALATGDRIVGNGGNSKHGLQVFPLGGGSPANSYVIHYSPGKRGIGDVEAVRHDGCLVVPPACALGVDVQVTAIDCQPAEILASTPLLEHCCGVVEYRFFAPDGTLAEDWDADAAHAAATDGTWLVEARCDTLPACTDSAPADVALVAAPGPQATLEIIPAVDCSRDRQILHVVPGSWGPCTAPAFEWLEDGVPLPGATGDSYEIAARTPAGTHVYTFVVRCPEPLPCGDTADDLTVEVEDPPTGPRVSFEETPATTCARPTYLLAVIDGSFGDCTAPGYQWLEDGVPVAGATGSRFFVPESTPPGDHAYVVVVTCPERLRCGDTSPPVLVTVADPSGTPRALVSEVTPPDCTRPTITLRVDPASVGPCTAPAYQWYEGGLAIAGATADTYVVPATVPAGDYTYHFVVTCPEPLPCGDTSDLVVVEVRDASGPLVDLVETPRSCARPLSVLTLVAGSFGDCTAPTYQWLADGAPIPGATGISYTIPDAVPAGPHDYVVVITCPEPLRCGDRSPPVRVVAADPATGPVLDLEVTPPVGCARAAYTVGIVPGSFGPCTFPFFEWWQDGIVVPDEWASTLVLDDALPAGTHVYHVVATCVETLPCDTSEDFEVLVEDPPPGPALRVVRTTGGTCVPDEIRLEVVVGSFGACTAPAYQWWRDGAPIAGATADTYTVPADETPGEHEYWYVVTCPEPLICGDEPPHELVDVGSGSPLAGRSLDGLLYVAKEPPSDLRFRWTDRALEATSYSLYEGAIGTWYSHGPLACHVPRLPPGAAQTEHVERMPRFDAYYLVSMNDCLGEGLVGTDSFLRVRPLSPAGVPCGRQP